MHLNDRIATTMPKGTVMVTKIHKTEHPFILQSGKASVQRLADRDLVDHELYKGVKLTDAMGWATPRSVMIAVTYSAGVMSNAGLYTGTPVGATRA